MPTPQWYEADTDDEDRHTLRDAIARLEKRDDERDDLRAEVERLRATVDRVEALADEWAESGQCPHEVIRSTCLMPCGCDCGGCRVVQGNAEREADLRAALAGGVAADAPTSSDGGAK